MSTSINFINYVCDQLKELGNVTYKKMFGEYMIYINGKPIVIVCDNIAFIKKLDCISEIMKNADTGFPYKGAKEHYILDIDNLNSYKDAIIKLESVTSIPKKRKK